jgi:hypothetical protein
MTAFWDMASCFIDKVYRRFGSTYCLRLMMEAVRNSDTSVYFNETTRRYVPVGCHLRIRRRDNLKSHKYVLIYAVPIINLTPHREVLLEVEE